MTWLLRSMDHSLSASAQRRACDAGIILEPGSLAREASSWICRRTRSGRNRNKPPQRVVNRVAGQQRELAHVGHRLGDGPQTLEPLVIAAPRQRREALLAQHLAHGGGTQRRAVLLERLADLVDRMVLLAQGHHQLVGLGLVRLGARAVTGRAEELRRRGRDGTGGTARGTIPAYSRRRGRPRGRGGASTKKARRASYWR